MHQTNTSADTTDCLVEPLIHQKNNIVTQSDNCLVHSMFTLLTGNNDTLLTKALFDIEEQQLQCTKLINLYDEE